MNLLLSPLQKAVNSLALALQQPKDEFIRDAVIQRFEYTYELCWKMLRRKLAIDHGEEQVKLLTRKELYRMAAEYHYLADATPWFSYHKARNETSHIYDETKAEEVFSIAQAFLPDAQRLLAELERRNED